MALKTGVEIGLNLVIEFKLQVCSLLKQNKEKLYKMMDSDYG